MNAADLFCGAGGTSTGLMQAARELGINVNLLAINHWPIAIHTHSLNYPGVRHKCESLDSIRPRDAIPSGHLGILAGSPECTHHSIAAGGRPRNDQSRATAWHICRWVSDLSVDALFVENVREFIDWGPLTKKGKPIKSRKGETFRAFISALRSMGYTVEYRVQNAADYGDPTSRYRLIIMGRRGKASINWPLPTHGPGRLPYRTARECIDWNLAGKSIFNRKKPLSPNTIRRIAAGIKKFGGASAEPFLVMMYGTSKAGSIDRPMPTITAHSNHLMLVEPFVLGQQSGSAPRSGMEPLPTIATKGAIALVQPLVEPVGDSACRIDIRIRMLQPHELSAAMSFPKDYKFYGCKGEQTKQIGNAVPVQLAKSHMREILKSLHE